MAGEDPKTPKEWALLCLAQYGRSEEFPGTPFPGLLAYVELAIKGAVEQEREACASVAAALATPTNGFSPHAGAVIAVIRERGGK